jgi:hypothetical protein
MKLLSCRIVSGKKNLEEIFTFSNCHIIGIDNGSLVLIVFGLGVSTESPPAMFSHHITASQHRHRPFLLDNCLPNLLKLLPKENDCFLSFTSRDTTNISIPVQKLTLDLLGATK